MTSGNRTGRQQGVLADWNDDRGFGFIEPTAGGPRVFAHVSAFPRDRRPASGCGVTYVEARDERGRPRAAQVRYAGSAPASRASSGRGVRAALVVVALVVGVLLVLLAVGELPLALLGVYGVGSVAAFAMYGADKAAAESGRWRTPESTLHAIDLVGGWPGGLVARHVFRHKTRKQPFRALFWVTVVVNCAALAWFVVVQPSGLP